MTIEKNANLAELTSLGVGGPAEKLVTIETTQELVDLLDKSSLSKPIWLLGSGSNIVVSDKGLPGTSILMHNQEIEITKTNLTAGAGVWWDDLVAMAIENNLWGIEFMSGIPGSVGAAVFGNIAAYGQAVSDSLNWIDVIDYETDEHQIIRLSAKELDLQYRSSNLQKPENSSKIIVRASFGLSKEATGQLEYDGAIAVAKELGLDADSLTHRREIILEARKRAGSMYKLGQLGQHKTAGSFFKNPLVTPEIAEKVLSYDESGASKQKLRHQNVVHGGASQRVSAAHVLLAAGFKRGQSWGNVRLHPDHVLKIENTGKASAQEIYDVVQEIISTVKEKLEINLENEVRFLGEY